MPEIDSFELTPPSSGTEPSLSRGNTRVRVMLLKSISTSED